MVEGPPPPSAANSATAVGPLEAAFARLLLHGLAGVAVGSPERQADLMEALQAAGLPTSGAADIRSALRLLVAKGCVADLRPLANGGMLVTVTGLDLLDAGDRRSTVKPLADPRPGSRTPRAAPDAPD